MKSVLNFIAKIATVALALALIIAFAGCEKNKPLTSASPAEITEKIMESVDFGEVIEIKDDILYNQYDALDQNDVADASVYVCATGGSVDEIAVVKAKSADVTENIKTAFESRLNDQKEKFQDYNANEMPKIDNAVIKAKGDTVILVISENAADAEKIFDELA